MYENFLAIIASILLHAALALALLLNLPQQQPIFKVDTVKQYEVVDAIAIDESRLLAKLGVSRAEALQTELHAQWIEQRRLAAIRYANLKKEEQRLEQEKALERERLNKLQQEREALKKQRLEEKQRLAKLRQKQEELKRKSEEEQKRLEREKEEANIAKQKAKREAAARQAEIERQIAQQRQVEIERQIIQQRQAEIERQIAQQRQAEIERQIAQQRQAAHEAEIKRQLEKKRQAIQDQRIEYTAAIIRQQVQEQWSRPSNISLDLTCRISVNLTYEGDVISARVITSSGRITFDNSAIQAVYKASPLSIPKDLYEHFKLFTFTFIPN